MSLAIIVAATAAAIIKRKNKTIFGGFDPSVSITIINQELLSY